MGEYDETGTLPPMPGEEEPVEAAAPEPVPAPTPVEEKPKRGRKPAAEKTPTKIVVMINPELPVRNPVWCPTSRMHLNPDVPAQVEDSPWVQAQLRAKALIKA